MFKNLSLRSRFLVAPVVGIALAVLLYFAAVSTIRSNAKVMEDLSASNLPQIAKINQLTAGLIVLQANMHITLHHAGEHGDEERIYLEGRQLLNRLHDLEAGFTEVRATLVNPSDELVTTLEQVTVSFTRYRETVISSIELSTVDTDRAHHELINSEQELARLNTQLLTIADHFVQQMNTASTLIEKSFDQNEWIGTVSILLLAMMVFFSIFLAGRMSKGLDEISNALLNLSTGKLDIELPRSDDLYLRKQQDALHDFRRSLIENTENKKQLEQNLAQLVDSEKRYQNLLDLIATAIVVIDSEQNIILFNKAAEQVFGYREDEIIGKNLKLLIPDEARKKHAELVRGFETGDASYLSAMTREPVASVRKNGDSFSADVSLSKIQLSSELLMVAAISDVSERVQNEKDLATYRNDLEVMVEQQTSLARELEFKNAELERFVYTVSHELRSPLITTKGFIGLLQRDLEAKDHDKVNKDLNKISQATDNMAELLEGLLELSRVGLVINPPHAGSLEALVYQAIDQLRDQIDTRGVEIEIDDDMPSYWGDGLRLTEVFQNLIENGIKFMGSQTAPKIHIGATRQGEFIVCSVEDNGIGIDPEYHDRIFKLFERLDQNIDGTGIGMALVQRIIHAHGGKIRVESDGNNSGSKFVFTIPAARPASNSSFEAIASAAKPG